MRVEGKGEQSPKPSVIRLTDGDMREIEYASQARTAFRNYSDSPNPWKRGMIGNQVFIGMLGEFAFARFLYEHGLRVSLGWQLLTYGDGGKDFVFNGLKIEVKTTGGIGRGLLIRRITDKKRIIEMADIYVFCEWRQPANPKHIWILGYIPKERLISLEKSPRLEHYNVTCRREELFPVSRLVMRIKSLALLDTRAASTKSVIA